MSWIDSAEPGDLVVCIFPLFGKKMSDRFMAEYHLVELPRPGALYTIRAIIFPGMNPPFLLLNEVINPPWPDLPHCETSFKFDCFMPIESRVTADEFEGLCEVAA